MSDDRLPTATLVADLRFLADADVESASRHLVPAWRMQAQERADLLRQAADRLEELTAAVTAARAEERERICQLLLGGSFLHDDAPAARLAREAVAAIRREPTR